MIPSGPNGQNGQALERKPFKKCSNPQTEIKNPFSYGWVYGTETFYSQTFQRSIIPEPSTRLVFGGLHCSGKRRRACDFGELARRRALRHEIRSAWLHWVTGGSTASLRLQKLSIYFESRYPIGLAGGIGLKSPRKS